MSILDLRRDGESLSSAIARAFNYRRLIVTRDPEYIDCNQERGCADLRSNLVGTIVSANRSTAQLLTGQRGSGKTTELQQVKGELESNGFRVVLFESDDLGSSDQPQAGDVLLALMRAVADQLVASGSTQRIPAALKPFEAVKTLVGDIASVLGSRIDLDAVEVDTALVKLRFTNPEKRLNVKTLLESRPTVIDSAAKEYLEDADERTRAAGYKGLVVMVDSLDRVKGVRAGSGVSVQRDLFVSSADRLNCLPCHIIFTLPPDLRFGTDAGNLFELFGTEIRVLPLVPVRTRDGRDDKPGLAALTRIVTARLTAGGLVGAVSDEAISALVAESGGAARRLMILVESCAVQAGGHRVERSHVEEVAHRWMETWRHAFSEQQRRELAAFEKEQGALEGSWLAQLYGQSAIMEYMDGSPSVPFQRLSPCLRRFLASVGAL